MARALTVLERMEHRGADPETGDGAGILLQVPDRPYREVVVWELPEPDRYGVAMCLVPQEESARRELESRLGEIVEAERQRLLGWG